MYAIAILRYRKPMEAVEKVLVEHRAYLKQLFDQGLILASGPMEPRNGGGLLLRVPDQDADRILDEIRDNDPFVKTGVAQYEILAWNPVFGKEGLDSL